MAKLAFNQLFRNGKPYMKRDDVFIDRIAKGQLFELSDDRGYLKVFDIKIIFQDGTESEYNSKDLKDESVARILKAEMLSCANQSGSKKKILLTILANNKNTPEIIILLCPNFLIKSPVNKLGRNIPIICS